VEVRVGPDHAGERGPGMGQVAGLLGQGALGVGQAQVVVGQLDRPAGMAADEGHPGRGPAQVDAATIDTGVQTADRLIVRI
jgi:hypothetical protein